MARSILACLLLLFLGLQPAEDTPPAAKRSSSPIALTPDGATLLVVNPDSNSLTLVATASHSLLAEVPVGVDPRSVPVPAWSNGKRSRRCCKSVCSRWPSRQ